MVNQSELTPFAAACGLRSPIDLRIVRSDGAVLAEGQLDLPCALAGRDPACEVTLLDAEISLRHACLQAVGGRVLVADIGSRTGLHLTEGELAAGPDRQPFLWLTPTDPVAVGPFRITLRKPLFVRPTVPETSPFLPDPAATRALPRVAVRFLNGKSVTGQWVVNRLVTFVGRARDCKISLAADDIDPFHCYFLLTPDGLWVVDLLSRDGLRVNGEATRYAHLKTGDVLQVGRFRLGFAYLDEPASPRSPERAVPPAAALPKLSLRPQPVTAGAPQTAVAQQTAGTPQTPGADASGSPVVAAPRELAPAVQAFAAAQSQMMAQFEASMMGMVRRFGELHREQLGTMHAELARMAELNAEMQQLQLQAADPLPGVWVHDRLAALQAERQTLWQRLFDLIAPQNQA